MIDGHKVRLGVNIFQNLCNKSVTQFQETSYWRPSIVFDRTQRSLPCRSAQERKCKRRLHHFRGERRLREAEGEDRSMRNLIVYQGSISLDAVMEAQGK